MFGAGERARLRTLEANLREVIIRAEAGEALAFSLLGRELGERLAAGQSCMMYMRSIQAELFKRVGGGLPEDLRDEAVEYVGAMLQPYWAVAKEYDEATVEIS